MRDRQAVLADGTRVDMLSLEVLLDIRDLLKKREKQRRNKVKNNG